MDTFLEFVVLQSTSLKPSNFLLLSSRGIQTRCQNYQGAPSIILMFVKAHHVVAHGLNITDLTIQGASLSLVSTSGCWVHGSRYLFDVLTGSLHAGQLVSPYWTLASVIFVSQAFVSQSMYILDVLFNF